MQRILILASVLICFGGSLIAQNVGINTTVPHPNAILDIKAVNKGLLIPRGNVDTRTALSANTAKGLMICDTTTNTIWIHNGNGMMSGWESMSSGTNHWKISGALGNEIRNMNSGGFWSAHGSTVLSDPGPVLPPVSGPGTRLMWLPEKSAFRAGTTDAGHWDAPLIGLFSFAGGLNTIASRSYALAMGAGTTSKGLASTALGWFTIANGDITTSLGFRTKARSYASVAIGRWNDSTAVSNQTTWIDSDPLFMIGNGTSESMRHNTMTVYKNGNLILKSPEPFFEIEKLPVDFELPIEGEGTRMMWLPELSIFRVGTVSDTAWDSSNMGLGSFALGLNSTASGLLSMATGVDTKASGVVSTAMGYGTVAKGYGSTTLGMFNAPILTIDQGSVETTTPLLIIGNGDSDENRSNAMVVRKDGHVGIGTDAPQTFLHVDVDSSFSDGFLVEGVRDYTVSTVPNLGDGSRMMFYPGKAAFRVGVIDGGNYWDNVNVGNRSVAMGFNTTASGTGSVAIGNWAQSTSNASIAMGNGPLASGDASTAFGWYTQANGFTAFSSGRNTDAIGDYTTAMGHATKAKGETSSAFGYATLAKGFSSTVIGMYNDTILTTDQTAVTPTTPLFIIGNGDGDGVLRNNAVVVRKDGRVGIGKDAPATRLDVFGTASNPTIPDDTSTGILRIGVNNDEGIDIGKMGSGSYAGWIQVGIAGSFADPLSLQPFGGGVGVGTSSPAGSSVLDVSSTSKGFLPPRMTFVNRNAISTPAAGLMIWCTNCGAYGQLQVYNGTFWANMEGSPAVGVAAIGVRDGGGIIAYIFQPGDPGYIAGQVHGLIATEDNQSVSADWGCNGTNIAGAGGTALGTGNQNTIDITNGCPTVGIAARVCSDLILNGFSDWYLPSKDELNKLYLSAAIIGNFSVALYWSSSETSSTVAWAHDFGTGFPGMGFKTTNYHVRAVRAF